MRAKRAESHKPLTKRDLLHAYRIMKTIREFEERVHTEFAKGYIPGFVHLYAGEEGSATGMCLHLQPEDRIASNPRGHGHCIAKGVNVHGMMAEIYGKKTGVCHGKGGSMHIADLEAGMMGANGIVGGGPPPICGAGLAAKVKKTRGVAVAFSRCISLETNLLSPLATGSCLNRMAILRRRTLPCITTTASSTPTSRSL